MIGVIADPRSRPEQMKPKYFSRSARWRRPTRQHVARWHREAGRESCGCEGGRKPKIPEEGYRQPRAEAL